jgi:hypothetical protein
MEKNLTCRDLLTASKAPSGPDAGYVIAAADAIVDRCNGQPLKEQGNFKLVVANDTVAERWVKSVAMINVVRATPGDTH